MNKNPKISLSRLPYKFVLTGWQYNNDSGGLTCIIDYQNLAKNIGEAEARDKAVEFLKKLADIVHTSIGSRGVIFDKDDDDLWINFPKLPDKYVYEISDSVRRACKQINKEYQETINSGKSVNDIVHGLLEQFKGQEISEENIPHIVEVLAQVRKHKPKTETPKQNISK